MDNLDKIMNDNPDFEVIDEVDIGNLEALKEDRSIIPPTRNIKLGIRKVSTIISEDNTYRMLNISMSLEDGIAQADGTKKFKGMIVWAKVTYYADPKKYTKDWFIKKQHLMELKKLVLATGGDIKNIKVTDSFMRSLENKVILGDIKQKINKFTAKDGTNIEEPQNYVSNFKPVPPEMMV